MSEDTAPDLAACISQAWSPQIGDPTVMGWVTVALYFLAALASFAAGVRQRPERGFWIALAVLLIALGINKQFDLQSAMTAVGRCLAQAQGWYEDRRAVQLAFISGLLGISAIVMITVLISLRRSLGRVGVAILGFGLLVTFVAVRAIGFHGFDRFIHAEAAFGIRANWILEIGGIVLILVNAAFAIRRPAPEPKAEAPPDTPRPIRIEEPKLPYTRFDRRR
jgi:hypothetical protein